ASQLAGARVAPRSGLRRRGIEGSEAVLLMTEIATQVPEQGLIAALIGDGRALFKLFALGLAGSGAFALFHAATGHFLPQHTAYLGMDARQLCAFYDCHVVHFMIHDRV